jgi:phage terminase small subunit
MAQRSERTLIDSDWVLKRLGQQADADMADLFDANGALKAVKDWPEVWRKGLIAGVEVFEEFIGQGEDRVSIGFTKKVKIADRLKNIELIGKHVRVGAFRDNVALTGSNGGPIQNVTMTQDQFKEIAKGIASEV